MELLTIRGKLRVQDHEVMHTGAQVYGEEKDVRPILASLRKGYGITVRKSCGDAEIRIIDFYALIDEIFGAIELKEYERRKKRIHIASGGVP